MTGFEVWLYFVVLPGISGIAPRAAAALSFLVVCLGVFILAAHMTGDFPAKAIASMKSCFKLSVVSMVLSAIASAIIPSEKQMAAILLVPAVSNSERLQGIGDKKLDTLNNLLGKWLKDVAPKGQVEKQI